MYFTSKGYQVLKFKNNFRDKSLLIVFHCPKLSLKEWVLIEQKFKKLKLNYSKPLNKVVFKEFKNSIYFNYTSIAKGFILFISFDMNSDYLFNLNRMDFDLKKTSFIKVLVKLNNKLYSPDQFKKCQNLLYKENMLKFNKVINKSLKTSYLLMSK